MKLFCRVFTFLYRRLPAYKLVPLRQTVTCGGAVFLLAGQNLVGFPMQLAAPHWVTSLPKGSW